MHISDLLGQYNKAAAAGQETVTGTKGVENLVSSLKSLTQGNIFEGTVSSIKNGRVTLALSGGSQINARMDGKVPLQVGQSMFFQVKSNDGSQIAIRPFVVDGTGVNYTLMQALSAAGLPAESNYLSMVNKMMEEQMPIDRNSLAQMARTVNTNSTIDVPTVVTMAKLGIAITPENASQFENYLGDKQAIVDAMDHLIDDLPMAMQGSDISEPALREMNARLLTAMTDQLPAEPNVQGDNPLLEAAREPVPVIAEPVLPEGVEMIEEQPVAERMQVLSDAGELLEDVYEPQPLVDREVLTGDNEPTIVLTMSESELQEAEAARLQPSQGEAAAQHIEAGQEPATPEKSSVPEQAPVSEAGQVSGHGKPSEAGQVADRGNGSGTQQMPGDQTVSANTTAAEEQRAQRLTELELLSPQNRHPKDEHTLGAVLNRQELADLNKELSALIGRPNVHYDPQTKSADLVRNVRELLDSEVPLPAQSLRRFVGTSGFRKVLQDVTKQQWTIRPEELHGGEKVNQFYENLRGQIDKVADVLKAAGQEPAAFTQTAADIKSNIDFMNQINQTFTYVQIPLQMAGKSASGELFVYTNKKAIAEGKEALTAFLHLDLDHLGSTDVSVKLLGKEVSTKFYLADDAAYDLIESHMDLLEERLREKGYHCTITVENEGKHVNFVEDFLKKDQPSAGQLHRYSFDMRA